MKDPFHYNLISICYILPFLITSYSNRHEAISMVLIFYFTNYSCQGPCVSMSLLGKCSRCSLWEMSIHFLCLLMISLDKDYFQFDVVPFVCFCFVPFARGDTFRKIMLRLMSKGIAVRFHLGVLWFQFFTFKAYIQFISSFRVVSFFHHVIVQFPQHHLLKHSAFPLYVLLFLYHK